MNHTKEVMTMPVTTTRTTRPRGTKPKPIRCLGDDLRDALAVNDDDRLNDEHALKDFRGFLLDDGVIDLEEAFHLSAHMRLDHELTRITGTLNADSVKNLGAVEHLVDQYRART